VPHRRKERRMTVLTTAERPADTDNEVVR